MPIASPLTNPQINGQIADLYAQIGSAKSWARSTVKAGGVNVSYFADETETQLDDKKEAVAAGLLKVASKGIALPDTLKVYCTGSKNRNFSSGGNDVSQQMKNCAYQRGMGGGQDPTMVLSPKVLDPMWAASLGGLCTKVSDGGAKGLCAAIVVHEVGHLLHELEAEDWFWGPAAAFPPNGLSINQIADEVSIYATTNAKELVAEVFLGRVYGKNFGKPVMDAYAAFQGPARAKIG